MAANQPETRHRCGAKLSRGRGFCRCPITYANGRCKLHGGTTPAGMASPQFTTGRFSKYLPKDLAARYNESLSNPRLLTLSDEIAVLDAHIGEVMEQLTQGECRESWQRVRELYTVIQTARNSTDPEDAVKAARALQQLGAAIAEGNQKGPAYDDLFVAMNQKRILLATEMQIRESLAMNVPVDRVMLFVSAMVDSIRRHVSDRKALQGIQTDLTRLLSVSGGAAVARQMLGADALPEAAPPKTLDSTPVPTQVPEG